MSRTILIAEDEPFIAEMYRAEMLDHGMQAVLAANGEEAIEAVKKQRFDLIILDLMMPVMDGYEVLAYFKKSKVRIPVIVVVTNLSADFTKDTCRKLGAEDYVVKSEITAAQLWEKIKIYLPVEN